MTRRSMETFKMIASGGKTSQMIKLRDGRVFGFAEYGDPKGKPLFYFHGWPASRLGAEKYHAFAKKLHVRIISPDRPGYGLSDYQKNRTLLDWPDDVVALADHLKTKKFAVMGVSGGGPYAAVCAYKIPQRITRIGIVVGLSPIYSREAFDGMMWMAKIGWANYGTYPFVRTIAAMMQYMNARFGLSLGLHRFFFGAKSDRKIYSDERIRQATKMSFREAFRRGYKGPELDLKLYTTDWGFKLNDIQAKVYLWYGKDDQNATFAMGKYYQSHILKSTLIVYPNEGHLISISHAEEILKALTV